MAGVLSNRFSCYHAYNLFTKGIIDFDPASRSMLGTFLRERFQARDFRLLCSIILLLLIGSRSSSLLPAHIFLQISILDKLLDFILEVSAFFDVMTVIIVKTTEFVRLGALETILPRSRLS
ncbi:UNVERIFIED_CONTAM: hypothetical protein Sradi_1548900 [Sesamum radiatum]|uniref:Uncharacterized protein n=1 Tax=Sesamum radiatum TaxID=300843 RepID=A0AAW2U9B7_SESRA